MLTLLVLLGLAGPAGLGDEVKVEDFARRVQQAVVAIDCKTLAPLVSYPITVSVGGRRTKIPSAASFIQRCAGILNRDFRQAIRFAKLHPLIVRDRRVMLGSRGEIWIGSVGDPGELRIIAIHNDLPFVIRDVPQRSQE